MPDSSILASKVADPVARAQSMREIPALPETVPSLPFRAWLRSLARVFGLLLVLGYFAFALIFLTLRYSVLPHIEDYRSDIEAMLSGAINLPVTLAGIEAEWQGLRPHLALYGFAVRDQEGRPALAFDKVEADVAWTSLLHLGLRLERIEIAAPSLSVRRDPEGRVFIAGLALSRQNQDNHFSDWLLAQHRVVVRDAAIIWQDETRGAPPLVLNHLDFHLQNDGSRHRFALNADPPKNLASRMDLRGDFRGEDLDQLADWQGEAYANLDYADLAVWRTWIDYPLELPSGSGGVRMWLGFAQQQIVSVTADISLSDAALRLAGDLPLLELRNVSGRLAGKRLAQGFEVAAKKLTLTTADGISIEPTDFQLSWNEGGNGLPAKGEFSANGLDLKVLSQLVAYLPVDVAARSRLAEAAPSGKLFDLKTSWSSAAEKLASFSLRARFERLGMHAQGTLPGFDGVSGSIDGSDKGGSLKLASKNALVDMPAIFADPRLALDTLNAQASWKEGKSGIEVKLDSFNFENRDAAGIASGRYAVRPGEPGEIDLTARLTRADGGAVARYMPLGVNKAVRDWLRQSISGGISNDTSLRLKGDVERFPFANGDGLFEVRGKFRGATLRYAPSWPQIDNITGELEFVGRRMTIKASRGSIYGVAVSDVRAQIDDLAAADEMIMISGRASGQTADFLRFVEASPVGERIDHFTDEMRATGNGQLELKLAMPLRQLASTRIEGVYQFTNNQLVVDPALPALTELYGRLQFSGDSLRAEKVKANLLGLPLTADLKNGADGALLLSADGSVNIAALRRQYELPMLNHLSGSTTWHGSVRVRKKSADMVIESKLLGISSSLPEPFNKSASDSLSLRFERRLLPEPQTRVAAAQKATPRDQIDVALGDAVAMRLVRRYEGPKQETAVLERGVISAGVAPVLPDRGFLLAINQKKIDVDFWRGLFIGVAQGQELPLTHVDLKAREFIVFGRSFNDLGVKAVSRDGIWHGEVNSGELVGELDWRGLGSGRLSGHLKQLALNETQSSYAASGGAPEELPGLDIEVDEFLLRGKSFGKLRLNADNNKGVWAAKLQIENEDGKLVGEGKWQPSPTLPDTRMQFTLTAKSVEKLLARLGYPNAVRRGQATLEGNVSWNGAPFAIDYPSLDGTMNIIASAGQFNKQTDPGAGRVLGILSLQSLPRRITLDFRDIFSEGFAFDSIVGEVKMSRGVMESRALSIQGTSAKILMSGSVNLNRETQDIKVRVQPAIGESLSVGAILLAHPVAGAVAFLVQKLLRDPIDQAFAFEYTVTGTCADPKVDKVSAPQSPDSGKATHE